MDRRKFLVLLTCGANVFVSGCLNEPGIEGGIVEAIKVDKPPNAEITEASDEQINRVGPIQEALKRANENGAATVTVSESEYDAVSQALSELPWYERDGNNTSNQSPSGIYVRYQNNSFVVSLTPFCTESWIVDSKSERGEYSWGGCVDR